MKNKFNNKQDLYRALVLKFGYFLVYLVGFRVQKKCKLKVSYFQTFQSLGSIFFTIVYPSTLKNNRNEFLLMRTPT